MDALEHPRLGSIVQSPECPNVTAVDLKGGAGNITRTFRRQEHDGIGKFLRCTVTAHGYFFKVLASYGIQCFPASESSGGVNFIHSLCLNLSWTHIMISEKGERGK